MRQLDIKQNKKRRTYSERFKAKIVAQCLAGDESIASVAMDYEINANLIHRWIADHRLHGRYDISRFEYDQTADDSSAVTGHQNWLAILPNKKQLMPTSSSATADEKPYSNNKNSGDINLQLSSGKLKLKLT